MRSILPVLLAAVCLSACAEKPPVPSSADARIDYIFENDMQRKAVCVEVGPFSMRSAAPPLGAELPGVLHPGLIHNREVAALASRFAAGEGEVSPVEISLMDVRDMGPRRQCDAWFSRPVTIDDISLIQFGAPSGLMGAYAFKRDGEEWTPVERIKLGYW